MKKYLPKIISWIVIIGLIFAFTIYISQKEKKTDAKERYKDSIRTKYEVYEEEPYDYFRGFDAGIKWAKENPEKIASSTSYEETIMETSYDSGYEAGYKSAKADYESELLFMQMDFDKEKAKAEEEAYDKGYEEGGKYGIYITDPQNRADYLDRYQEGYNDGYEDGAAGKPMWQGF